MKNGKLDFSPDERDILIYAFRYALGRRSYSVSTVVDCILKNWENLQQKDKNLFKKEIQEAINIEHICDPMDKKQWTIILNK